MRKLLIGIIGATFMIAAPAHAQKYNLTLAGASPGGLWSLIGAGMDKVLAKAYPGSTITYQTSSGGLANAKLVQDGKVPMGITVDTELSAAVNGAGPFKGKKQKDLRVLFRVYSPSARFQLMHILVNGNIAKKYGITTMADLKKQARNLRVAVNRRGNMDGDLALAVMKGHGVDSKRFKRLVHAASKEMTSLMLDRRIDVMALGISYRHRTILQVMKGFDNNLVLLDVGPEVSADVATRLGGQPCIVKQKEYPFLTGDVRTVCFGAVIVAHKNMKNKTAYDLTRAMIKYVDVFKTAHRALKKATTPQSLAEGSVAPHHPGAAKAFKEAGLL